MSRRPPDVQAILGIKVMQNPREGMKSKEGLTHSKSTILSSKGIFKDFFFTLLLILS